MILLSQFKSNTVAHTKEPDIMWSVAYLSMEHEMYSGSRNVHEPIEIVHLKLFVRIYFQPNLMKTTRIISLSMS